MRKLVAVLFLFQAATAAAADCDRACLRGLVTQTLDAFVAHQPNAAFAPAFTYVEDTVVTRPGAGLWKERTPGYGMFEYACHEGNHGMSNMLSAARALERTAR